MLQLVSLRTLRSASFISTLVVVFLMLALPGEVQGMGASSCGTDPQNHTEIHTSDDSDDDSVYPQDDFDWASVWDSDCTDPVACAVVGRYGMPRYSRVLDSDEGGLLRCIFQSGLAAWMLRTGKGQWLLAEMEPESNAEVEPASDSRVQHKSRPASA